MLQKKIKIKDIAEVARVSVGTVDRVLNNRGDVSEKTKEKVLKIIEELGYQTNIIAKTLALKKNIVFATIIPKPDGFNNFWEKPAIGFKKAENEFSRYGIQIRNYTFELDHPESVKACYQQIMTEKPDAVVIAPVLKKESTLFVSELNSLKIPYIFLDSDIENDNNSTGYIGHDSYQSGKVAARLIETRTSIKDNILLINLTANPKNQNHLNQRSAGFRDYFSEKDRIGTLFEIDITNLNESFIDQKLSHIFETTSNIKAIYVTTSKAHIIADYMCNNDLNEKIILLGYDLIEKNTEHLKSGTIDYLISQNPVEQGYRSIEKLFKSVVLKQKTHKNTYLPIEIVIKENVMYYED